MSESGGQRSEVRYFFDDPAAVDRLRKEANEWLWPQPTPFRKFGCIKGPGGGVYCVAFAQALMSAAGVTKSGEFLLPHGGGDYQSANTMRRITKYMIGRGKLPDGSIDPKSARLAEIFVRKPIVRELRKLHGRTPHNIDASLFMPGDLLILRDRGLFHMPVMLGRRVFVSAIPGIGVREGDLHDTTYSTHIAGLFRAVALQPGTGGV